MLRPYYLSIPHSIGDEGPLVVEALNGNGLKPIDFAVNEFEKAFGERIGTPHVAAVSSGTAALHLALKAAGVGPGDTVLCSTMTFAASANPIIYLGATPVFVDCDSTMTVAPSALESAIASTKPRAIVSVDIYGNSPDYAVITEMAEGIPIIEDAAEALGATFNGTPCGRFGMFGAFSFNTNKLITTGGGGLVVCSDEDQAAKISFWARQSKDPDFYYTHSELGFNYRMNAVGAAVGISQLRHLDQRLARKRAINTWYRESLSQVDGVEVVNAGVGCESAYWLTVVRFDNVSDRVSTRAISEELALRDIETRPVWRPLHSQPFFRGTRLFTTSGARPLSEQLAETCLCLPSDVSMSRHDVETVSRSLCEALGR